MKLFTIGGVVVIVAVIIGWYFVPTLNSNNNESFRNSLLRPTPIALNDLERLRWSETPITFPNAIPIQEIQYDAAKQYDAGELFIER
jgi:hypothetical protein